jgi:hypothetical protein
MKTITALATLCFSVFAAGGAAAIEFEDSMAYEGKNTRGSNVSSGGTATLEQALSAASAIPSSLESGRHPITTWSEADSFGNRFWGAGYDLSYESYYDNVGREVNLSSHGSAGLWGRIFGDRFDALRVHAAAKSLTAGSDDRLYVEWDVYAMGQEILDGRYDTPANVEFTRRLLDETQPVVRPMSHTFIVWIIPVTVEMRADARETVDFSGVIGPQRIAGTVTPAAKLYGVVESYVGGSVDLGFARIKAGAGVSGEVNLVRTLLPVEASLTATLRPRLRDATNPNACGYALNLAANVNGTLNLRALDGSLSVFAEAPIIGRHSKNVFRWDSVARDYPLFDLSGSAWRCVN